MEGRSKKLGTKGHEDEDLDEVAPSEGWVGGWRRSNATLEEKTR